MKRLRRISCFLGISLAFTAYAGGSKDAEQRQKAHKAAKTAADNQENATTVVGDITDRQVTVVEFDSGGADVSPSERAAIRALVLGARDDGAVGEVVVAAWADKAVEDKTAASPKTSSLAEKRAANIKNVLAELGVKSVQTYNMAEKPNWFERTFKTDEARVKQESGQTAVRRANQLDGRQVHTPDDARMAVIGDALRTRGGPATAVIIIGQMAH